MKTAPSHALLVAVFGAFLAACSSGVVPIGIDGTDSGARDGAHPDVGLDGKPGSDTGSSDTGASLRDTGTPDGSTPSCPSAEPMDGAACPDVGEVCEYGSNASAVCNHVFTCTASGWTSKDPAAPCPTSCPATYPTNDDPCSPDGLVCSYAQGTCGCAVPIGPVLKDGGKSDRWRCSPKKAGCPSPRPSIGSPCPSPATGATVCDYAACAGGVELACKGGVWTEVKPVCPAS